MTFKTYFHDNRISQTFTGHVYSYSCELKTRNVSMYY